MKDVELYRKCAVCCREKYVSMTRIGFDVDVDRVYYYGVCSSDRCKKVYGVISNLEKKVKYFKLEEEND